VRATDTRNLQGAFRAGPNVQLGLRQENVVSIAYVGAWSTIAAATYSGGATRWASTAGASAKLTFTGTNVAWVTSKGQNHGRAEVWLDGVRRAAIDLHTPTFRSRQIVFAWNGLSNTTHTLEIRVLGTKSAAATGTRVGLDAFVVLSPVP
jgi:hypothetical protein